MIYNNAFSIVPEKQFKFKPIYSIVIGSAGLLCCFNLQVKAQYAAMRLAPWGAYQKYFRYVTPGAPGMPEGTNEVSNAVVGIQKTTFFGLLPEPGGGTGFLINTFRNDGKIGLVTAGHVIDAMLGSNQLPPDSIVEFDIYMKYLGRENSVFTGYNQVVSGYKTTVHAKVVKYSSLLNNNRVPDIALALIDKEELPVKDFTMLRYSFNDVFTPGSSFFLIGHPNRMPQMLADNMQYNLSDDTRFLVNGFGNNSMSFGASGAPCIYKAATGGWFVGGVQVEIVRLTHKEIPANEYTAFELYLYAFGNVLQYANTGIISNKIESLYPDIKKYCWPTAIPEEELINSQNYKQNNVIDNHVELAAFHKSWCINSFTNFLAAANPGYKTKQPYSVLLKGDTVTISCALTPGIDRKNIYGLAKVIKLTNGFSYTAAGDSVLEMNTVVAEPGGSPAANFRGLLNKSVTQQNRAEPLAGFMVRPNPSATGIFEVAVPAATGKKGYTMAITTADARTVKQQTVYPGEKEQINLSGKSRGVYMLAIYHNAILVYSTQLVY